MPRPLPEHLIPTIKEVTDEETNQRSVVRPRNSVRDGSGSHTGREGVSRAFGGADLTETAPTRAQVGLGTPRDTVAPSGPRITVTSTRSSEDGKVIGDVLILPARTRGVVIHDYHYCGNLDDLRKLLCSTLETLDAAVADHHRAKAWDEQRTVTYGDPITMQFIANTDYIAGDGRST